MDGKYPKIPGSADPDPGRTFISCPKFVRGGHELGAAASSARCRSHLSNHTLSIFSPSRLSYALPFRLYLVGAPSSVIAYGDATFPPVGGRLCGRPHGAAPTGVIGGKAPYTPKKGGLGGFLIICSAASSSPPPVPPPSGGTWERGRRWCHRSGSSSRPSRAGGWG